MKNIKILLAVILSTVILSGCGKANKTNNDVNNSNSETEIVENTEETTDIISEASTTTTEETVNGDNLDDDNGSTVQKKDEEDTSIEGNTNEDHSEEKNDINLNYIVYHNDKYGFQIKYPKELTVSVDGLEDEGMAVTNEEGDFCIYAYGFNNEDGDTIDSMKNSLMIEGAEPEAIDDGFILSYIEDDTVNKYVLKIGTGSINAMVITYPTDKEEVYKDMVKAIIGNFTTGDLSKAY